MSRLPTGTSVPSTSGPGGQAVGELDAAARDAEQHEVVGALVVLEDLVRDAAQGPGHVAGGEHLTPGRDARVAVGCPVRAGWTRPRPDLLPCLTGRSLKDVVGASLYPARVGPGRGPAGRDRRFRTGLDLAQAKVALRYRVSASMSAASPR